MLVAAQVELPANLFQDPEEVAAARGRRVEAHRVEITTQRLGHPDRLELLVLQGVDQGHPAHLGIDHLVEGPQRFHRVAEEQHQRVRNGAHRIRIDELGGLRHRDPVAAAHERVALDHRREGRVHAARPEGDHLARARRALAAGRLRRDAGGLAEEAQQRRLVLRPLRVDALDEEHGVFGPEQRALVHGPDVHRQPVQQRGRLLDAGEDAEGPVGLGEALEPDLGLDPLVETAGAQDLDGSIEVDVRDLAGFDLGVRGRVEGALGALHIGADTSRP